MEEIIRYALGTTGGLGVILAGVYAAIRIMRQGNAWQAILAAKDAELKRKDEEIAYLHAELDKQRTDWKEG